ncbi:50S ribosomal protein L10 [Ornithinibacillus sp. 4-3]|uniref:Large ribosomal subunit protein uL10 n=1 Tax=Ornithinibacillus sp. 4-3 TaxID=3231488 RepID=A0AB39HT09_9BACI
MSKVLERKQSIVQEISEKFQESQTAVVVDYRGLSVSEVTALRKELRDAGVEYKVYKNTLTRRAVADTDLQGLTETLTGPTAVAFSKDDVVAPAKILSNFAKDHEMLEIKGGVIEGNVATLDQIKELATLPDHNGLVSMLLSVLQAPIRNLAYAAKAVADQKDEAQEA